MSSPAHAGRCGRLWVVLGSVLLASCTPPLDWREVRVEGTAVRGVFPCRPERHERSVRLAGETVRLAMLSCPASGLSFSLAHARLVAPDRMTAALQELRDVLSSNLGAERPEFENRQVPGATPNQAAGALRLRGRRPDGTPVHAHAVFFASGLTVFQATALSQQPIAADVVATFIDAVRVAPTR